MIVDLYICDDEEFSPRFGLMALDRPASLLPGQAAWRYLRDLDTRDLELPEAIEEEIGRSGFWATRERARAATGRPDAPPGSVSADRPGILSPPPAIGHGMARSRFQES